MNKLIAIGDIHGCIDTFEALLAQLAPDKSDRMILLGDLIDRGPHSKMVIDKARAMQNAGYQLSCIRGNHEQMLLDAFYGSDQYSWFSQGGKETLESFGVLHPRDIAPEYISWMNALPYYLEEENFIFTHAGLNMRVPDPLQDTESMLWIRMWYKEIHRDWLGARFIVHGHTPRPAEQLEEQLKNLDRDRVLNLDTGCYVDESNYFAGYHRLSACDLKKRMLYEEKRRDAVFYGK